MLLVPVLMRVPTLQVLVQVLVLVVARRSSQQCHPQALRNKATPRYATRHGPCPPLAAVLVVLAVWRVSVFVRVPVSVSVPVHVDVPVELLKSSQSFGGTCGA